MNEKLTLGSLFDGSGGFPLGGLLCGIEPLWASEVEPFPIRVTTKRLPQIQHFGDINKINGAEIPPVDIITGGFCCQDLSVAGKRAGLHGERSGLFFQVIRIVEEMRTATNNRYPTFVVLENVLGMYSSAGGADFLEVLNELIKIKNKTLSVHMPESGKWNTAGEIVGDGFSLGWRTFDAQFWGVAQRRRRCYIVVDLAGERAGKILFDETRLRGNPPQGCFTRKGAAGDFTCCSGSPISILNDQGGSCMDVSENITGTLRAQEHGHQPIIFEPGAMIRVGGHVLDNEISGTLRADMGDNHPAVAIPINTQVATRHISPGEGTGFGVGEDGDPAYTIQAAHHHAVAVENHPADSRVKLNADGVIQTLSERMGTGGGNVPLVMNERQYALTVGEDVANTLTGTDYKGTQCVFEPTAYGISSYESNAMKSDNPHSGIYEADTARTLDSGGGRPDCNQGGIAVVFDGKQITSKDNRSNPQPGSPCHTLASGSADNAVVCLQGNMIGRADKNGPQGSGINEDVSFTLTGPDRHAVCYQDNVGALCASDYKFPQQQQIGEGKAVVEGTYQKVTGPLMANSHPGSYSGQDAYQDMFCANHYAVRRLTPTECALLQGFPPDWCAGLGTPEPSEEDIAFWSEVWEIHRLIIGKSTKPKSRNQIIKWLISPHGDAAEYKMWGNGVALPCVVFVLGGIAFFTQT